MSLEKYGGGARGGGACKCVCVGGVIVRRWLLADLTDLTDSCPLLL